MLVVDPAGERPLLDSSIRDLIQFLKPGDALVLNNTRVLPAALVGVRARPTGQAKISVNLVKRLDAQTWQAFCKPGRRLAIGDQINYTANDPADAFAISSEVLEKSESGLVTLKFNRSGPELDLALNVVGRMPLPPYINARRAADDADQETYQTVFAKRDGAVAAPTAGLHFTQDLLQGIEAEGIALHFVTLHVGAGTFLPVKSDDTADHEMHAEWGELTEQTARALNEVRARGGRIVAVGTTSLRLLESAADDEGAIQPFCDETSIFIQPGYRFKAVDVLLTNFHLPKSTLFMLVSAFSGLEHMKAAYDHAVANAYRFYSYGDATLLFLNSKSSAK